MIWTAPQGHTVEWFYKARGGPVRDFQQGIGTICPGNISVRNTYNKV